MSDFIETNNNEDGIDRRGFLKCMAWAGTGVVYTMAGGIAVSRMLGTARAADALTGDFSFVQISDSHIGFNKERIRMWSGPSNKQWRRSSRYPKNRT